MSTELALLPPTGLPAPVARGKIMAIQVGMGSKVDDNTRAQIHSQVLNEMIAEKMNMSQQEKLDMFRLKQKPLKTKHQCNVDLKRKVGFHRKY